MSSHLHFHKPRISRIPSIATYSVISTEVLQRRHFFSWYLGGFVDLSLSLTLTHRKIISFAILTWSFWEDKLLLIYIQQDATLHGLFYLETALHVSGGTTTHHQERKELYLQHLVFVRPLLLPTTIAAGSSNGLTNTRCCRYSCLRSWWWVVVPPETCRAVSR